MAFGYVPHPPNPFCKRRNVVNAGCKAGGLGCFVVNFTVSFNQESMMGHSAIPIGKPRQLYFRNKTKAQFSEQVNVTKCL